MMNTSQFNWADEVEDHKLKDMIMKVYDPKVDYRSDNLSALQNQKDLKLMSIQDQFKLINTKLRIADKKIKYMLQVNRQ